MKNPYEVLGISPTATNEEVRDAYRALAKKYQPDNYAGNPLADMAEEKMKEINSAYDEILHQRAEAKNNASNGENSQNSDTGRAKYANSTSNNPRYSRIRYAINGGDMNTAESLLNEIDEASRDAEWYFLKGCILLHSGYVFDAIRYINKACTLDPNNEEYKMLLARLQANSSAQAQRAPRQGVGCSICDICSAIICIDCLCGR